jgi:hypothetical protein
MERDRRRFRMYASVRDIFLSITAEDITRTELKKQRPKRAHLQKAERRATSQHHTTSHNITMSTRTPAAPITPGFAWALPEVATVEPKAKKSPVSNPLLERASPRMNNGGQRFGGTNGFSAATATRLPFSPMDNKNSLRQRRKPSSTFLPPKSSLTEGSYALDENLQTNHKEVSNLI